MFEFQELTKPALFTLFGRDVTAYALFLTLGVLIGVLMSINRAKRTHYDVNAALLFPVLAIPLSVIFGRLVYCLCSIVLLLDNGFGFIFRIDYGGFSIMGVTIGLALAALLTAKIEKVSFLDTLDCVVPGLLMGVLLMVMVLYFAIVRRYERHPFRLRALIRQFLGSIPALITPVIILCGFVVGWFTPTEASSIAVIYSLLIALFLYRTLDWKSFKKCLKDSAISSANTLFIIGTSTLFTYVMAMEGISRQFADVILGISSNPNVVLLVINVLLLVLGMVMEPGAILTLMLPVLLPIANGLGLDLVHFGVMVVLNLMIGQVTPPFGVCLFVISDVNKLKLERLYRSILPFLVPLILTLILVTYIPGIVTALPNALLS